MLRPELSRDSNFVDRFHIEAKSLGNLNHSNITTLYALHAEGDDAFMVMELVHGNTLEALLNRVQRLTLRDSLAVLAQTVAGMRYAHRRGVIHRDIKPANLMLTDDGVVKIMDFGIARVRGSQHLTRVGEFCGTFVYASPEQIRGEEADERSDLYSLAIVFYSMLAGTAPFTSDNEYALMTAQLQAPPPPLAGRVPDLDAATEAVLMRALAKRPEDRFASVEEFGRAVGAMALRGESIDILQQLYARAFGSEDLEATRIMTAARPAAVEPTMPSHPPNGRGHDEWELPSSLPGSEPASAEPWSSCPPRQSVAPSATTSSWPSAAPLNERAARRPWLIGAGALAVPLVLGAGYYLLVPNGVVATHSSLAPQKVALADTTPAPPPGPVPTISPPEPRDTQIADPHPPAASPPEPNAAAAAEPQLLQPAEPTPADEVKPEPSPGVTLPLSTASPPPAEPSETASRAAEPAKAVPDAPVKAELPQPPTLPVSAGPPPSAPTEAVSSQPHPATTVPDAPATAETLATPNGTASGVQVASAEPQSPSSPAPALGPQAPAAAPQPEGKPDIEGRVTGAKGLNEIELDKTRWIKVYGIVDRANGSTEAQHAAALVRYLKPSRNHLVCYRKSGDTYRCYSDGQDIARLALMDRLVQLAPNAPPEYRLLVTQRR